MAYAKMWFGTEDKMQWVDCPLQGADVSPVGWETSGTLLNGGGYASHSWATHRQFTFEWRQSSARRMAQIMHNYRDGVYGRGLLYFLDPLAKDLNVLPKQWAYPALMADELNNPFYRGVELTRYTTPTNRWGLPVEGATIVLDATGTSLRPQDSVFIPRPTGEKIRLWAFYTLSGDSTGGLYGIPVNDAGQDGSPVKINPTTLTSSTAVGTSFSTGRGVRLCVMRKGSGASTVRLYGMMARVSAGTPTAPTEWEGGQGHSGVRFVGTPTYIENNGVGGGQVSYAASFMEVGDWL